MLGQLAENLIESSGHDIGVVFCSVFGVAVPRGHGDNLVLCAENSSDVVVEDREDKEVAYLIAVEVNHVVCAVVSV